MLNLIKILEGFISVYLMNTKDLSYFAKTLGTYFKYPKLNQFLFIIGAGM